MARSLHEDINCARGEMENRIKECPGRPLRRPHLDGHDARQPAASLVRLHGVRPARRAAPHRPRHSEFAQATCGTLRQKLLAIASAAPAANAWRLAPGQRWGF
jgi:hypothetical protein